MILNDAGNIANECWLEIPKHFPNAVLYEYVVMPNHIHGIIELKHNNVGNVGIVGDNANVGDVANVGAENFLPLPQQSPVQNEFQKMIPHSIGSIVKGFKIGVTKRFQNLEGLDPSTASASHFPCIFFG